jgi:hypothetical protein
MATSRKLNLDRPDSPAPALGAGAEPGSGATKSITASPRREAKYFALNDNDAGPGRFIKEESSELTKGGLPSNCYNCVRANSWPPHYYREQRQDECTGHIEKKIKPRR